MKLDPIITILLLRLISNNTRMGALSNATRPITNVNASFVFQGGQGRPRDAGHVRPAGGRQELAQARAQC